MPELQRHTNVKWLQSHIKSSSQYCYLMRSASELDEISRILNHPKVGELSKKIHGVNPKRDTTTGKGGPDIFEI
ncbi:MAG: hypothetical protein M3P08_17865 [Thermoproteota archaeon]|jgi:hypothetical protein|nr:hypothetical protein [Thermoproteota archaeon]